MFWHKIDIKGKDECWNWKGSKNPQGYGQVWSNSKKKQIKAHRLAYEIYNQTSIPKGMLICHKCDNPPCCNPYHLFLGTSADNINDAYRKGRKFGKRFGAVCIIPKKKKAKYIPKGIFRIGKGKKN